MSQDAAAGGDARLTVVIPTCNRRSLLERSLGSVLAQMRDGDGIRVHVWDNHSSDGTEDYMRGVVAVNRNVHYTRRPENIGAMPNFVDAISKVETEFYVALADDDYLIGNFLPDALRCFAADPSLGAVIMRTFHVATDGQVTRINPDDRWRYGRMEPAEMMRQWCGLGHLEWSSIIFRKSAYDEVGGLDLKHGLSTDVAYQMNVFLRYPVFLVAEPAAVYSLHAQQHTSMHMESGVVSGKLRFVEEFIQLIAEMESRTRSSPELNPVPGIYRRHCARVFSRAWRNSSPGTLCYLVSRIAGPLRSPRQAVMCVVWWLISRVPGDPISVLKKSGKSRSLGDISDYIQPHSQEA